MSRLVTHGHELRPNRYLALEVKRAHRERGEKLCPAFFVDPMQIDALLNSAARSLTNG